MNEGCSHTGVALAMTQQGVGVAHMGVAVTQRALPVLVYLLVA